LAAKMLNATEIMQANFKDTFCIFLSKQFLISKPVQDFAEAIG
jgi:hypothetical protein